MKHYSLVAASSMALFLGSWLCAMEEKEKVSSLKDLAFKVVCNNIHKLGCKAKKHENILRDIVYDLYLEDFFKHACYVSLLRLQPEMDKVVPIIIQSYRTNDKNTANLQHRWPDERVSRHIKLIELMKEFPPNFQDAIQQALKK